jgi:hypothetical protein
MMRESSRATTWTCDNGCGVVIVRTDLYQDVPPDGWRLIQLLPVSVDLALRASSAQEIKTRVLCTDCFDMLVAGTFENG